MSADLSNRVLVTGATGFLARHLLARLDRSLALVRSPEAWESLPHRSELRSVVPIAGSLDDSDTWAAGLPEVPAIIHTAALVRHSRRDADEVYRTNVEGTLAMVRLAARLQARLVFVSTSGTVACFRTPDEKADEEAPYCSRTIRGWPYYHSKMAAEIAARELATKLGVELVIVRLPVLLGPGDHRGRSTSLVARVIRGRQPYVVKGGMAFTDVRDAAAGLAAAAVASSPRPVYHLAGTSYSLAEFCAECARLSGARPPSVQLPRWLALSYAHMARMSARLGLGGGKVPDPVVVEMGSSYWGFSSRWAHELGYTARSKQETLQDTISWLRAESPGHE